AAGPKGRSAQAATDASMRAEILTYSRSRGLFAGISLEGSTLRPDGGANENLYGRKTSPKRLVQQPGPGGAKSASLLVLQLNQHSSNKKGAQSFFRLCPFRRLPGQRFKRSRIRYNFSMANDQIKFGTSGWRAI